MSESTIEQARREIEDSLILSTFCMRRIGLSFTKPEERSVYIRQKVMFIMSICSICYHVFGDIVFIIITLSNSPRIEDVVPLFHTFGYGALSIAKVFVLWYKKDVFAQLLIELAGIWPVAPLEEEAQTIKTKSLSSLSLAHRCYFYVNIFGVWFYNLTPICLYYYSKQIGKNEPLGFVWTSWYPFDKHKPFAHFVVYLFEIFAVVLSALFISLVASYDTLGMKWDRELYSKSVTTWTPHFFVQGLTCVWIMVSTDLLFSTMSSHICLLLRLLQRRLESLGTIKEYNQDIYEDILVNIKLHQRLITYCNDLENAFSLSNFINIMMSSVNICCVVFVIVLLEPFLAISNKMFLGSVIIQIGMLCWYADDIFHANAEVAQAAYKSGWYHTNPRCRRALFFLILRSHKPIAFTAMGFTNISLVTYSAILTRSYSYFALLYTMYSDN